MNSQVDLVPDDLYWAASSQGFFYTLGGLQSKSVRLTNFGATTSHAISDFIVLFGDTLSSRCYASVGHGWTVLKLGFFFWMMLLWYFVRNSLAALCARRSLKVLESWVTLPFYQWNRTEPWISRRVLTDFRWFIRHLSSVVKSAALKRPSYPQVPGSIPAENTSTQIHIDLSK